MNARIWCGHCSVANVMAVSNIILSGHCSVAHVMAVSNIILCGHCSVADVMAVPNIILCGSFFSGRCDGSVQHNIVWVIVQWPL